MAITATCTFCERTITLGIENQWFDSHANYRCGEGSHIGWHHTPKGSTISRKSVPFVETAIARNALSPTAEDNPRVPKQPKAAATMHAHTPGPWTAEMTKFSRFQIWATINGNKEAIAKTNRVIGLTPEVGNASLIAAAPQLLEALEELMMILKDTALPTAVEGYVRAAIAKAKGKE